MKDSGKKDSILTVAGLLLLVGVFIFVFYLPGKKVGAQIQNEMTAAERDIQSVPTRVAELEMLHKKINDQQKYLERTEPAFPEQVDLHAVVERVSNMAKNNQLKISRMELSNLKATKSSPFTRRFPGHFRG